jgi:hypothetical protein
VIWTALALAISTITGLVLIRALWPSGKSGRSDWLLQFSLACGFGLGATSLVLFLVLSVKGSAGRIVELLTDSGLLLGLLAAWFLRPKAPAALSVEWRTQESRVSFLWGSALALALASTFVSFILVSRRAPHGSWDGWSIWNLHARFLFRGGQFWKDTFSPLLDYYKPDYPLLIPASVVRLWTYTNHEVLFAPALVAATLTFAVALLTTSAVARLRGSKQGILAGLLVLGTPAFVDLGASQCADVAVAFFFLATLALFCLNDCLGHNRGYLALSGIAAGMAAWAKNEGLMLLLVVLAVRIALSFRTLRFRGLVRQHTPFVAGLTPVILPILYFKARLVPTNDMVAGQGLHATLDRLVSLSRYKITGKAFVHETLFFGGWFAPIILVLAFYALLVGFSDNAKFQKAVTAPVLALAASGVGYFFVYILTPHDVAWQLKWSLERVFMQLWPAAIFAVFVLLRTPDEAITGAVGIASGESARGTNLESGAMAETSSS